MHDLPGVVGTGVGVVGTEKNKQKVLHVREGLLISLFLRLLSPHGDGDLKWKKRLRGISLLASCSCMAPIAFASPLACCSRVTFRNSPKWRPCSQAIALETSTQLQDLRLSNANFKKNRNEWFCLFSKQFLIIFPNFSELLTVSSCSN